MNRRLGRNGRRIAYWTILAVLGGVLALVLATGAQAASAVGRLFILEESVYRYIDPDTGCHYLSVYRSSLVPRIAADGKTHLGCGAVKP